MNCVFGFFFTFPLFSKWPLHPLDGISILVFELMYNFVVQTNEV